jgi:class 3 adenylate cyclase
MSGKAIACACAIVEDVRDLGLEVRAGLHTGECELVEGKVRESPCRQARELSTRRSE